MQKSIRSTLFLLITPLAIVFTLVAWTADTRLGPLLHRPLLNDCTETGLPEWLCRIQEGLLPWLAMGLGILLLMAIMAFASLYLLRSRLEQLQREIINVQRGHQGQLSGPMADELMPLVQLLNRILASGARQTTGTHSAKGSNPLAREDTSPAGAPPIVGQTIETPTDTGTGAQTSSAGADTSNQASLTGTDHGAPQRPAAKERPTTDRASPQPRRPTEGRTGHPVSSHSERGKVFPARRCRALMAGLATQHPQVSFDLDSDVDDSTAWNLTEAELTEVFGRLLVNAAQRAHSQVQVYLAIKGNMLFLRVADDGPGIAGDATGPEDLTATRRLIDTHGGTLVLDSSTSGGLEAIATLPG